MSREKVLALLTGAAEGEYISGEGISARLGISRAAVWKVVDGLRQEGYEIDSVPRKGYRLTSAPNALTEGRILPYVESEYQGARLICLNTVDSTNTYAKRLAMEGGEDGTVVVANEQTGGRGRQGHVFQSPGGVGVYLSLILKPQAEPREAVNLTAYVAVAVCDAIQRVCGVRPGIKWMNDIFMGGRKIGGILTEMAIEGESGCLQYVVTGIGINVCQRPGDFPPELSDIASSLYMETGQEVDRGRLAAEMINALKEICGSWKDGVSVWERYRQDCITLGHTVMFRRNGAEQTAFAEDVDSDFGLVVRFPDGHRETVSSGEVSVLPVK